MTAPQQPNPLGTLTARFGRVPMELRVEFGRTKRLISEVLSTKPGDIIKMDRRQGDPATLLVGDRALAEGDLVHITGTDQMGFRVTRLLETDPDLGQG